MGGGFEPRYSSKESFEKDFPKSDIIPQSVRCPGCGQVIALNRKSLSNKSAGWCRKCVRAVTL
ncbi:MAG: hypothetical protein ACP5IO_00580 [Elusimicrobiales bacterium]